MVRRFHQTPTGAHGKKILRTYILYSNKSRQLIFLSFLPPALLYSVFSSNVFEHATENLNSNNNNNNNCNNNTIVAWSVANKCFVFLLFWKSWTLPSAVFCGIPQYLHAISEIAPQSRARLLPAASSSYHAKH